MPNPNDIDNTDGYSDTFAADVAGDIGASLFSEAPKEPVETLDNASQVETKPAVQQAVAEIDPNAYPVIGQNSQMKPLPKSWKKDMAPAWEKLDPSVHDYVYAREADVMRGIQQYQQGAQQWTNLIQPFEPLLAQHPNVNPVQLLQGLMNTHLQLLDPGIPPAQKAAVATKILLDYGIDLSGAVANQPPETAALMQELQTLRGTVQQLKSGFQQRQEIEQRQSLDANVKIVEAFASDPKNKYFPELENDILRFIQTGVATDLASAYELASWSNPEVRAKMLAEQQASAASANPRNKRNGQFINVESSDPAVVRKTKPQSMDATIESVVAAHFKH